VTQAKQFDFPAEVEWEGGSLTVASVAGKHDLDVATPPEFGGEAAGLWSPEDLLVAAAASCFAVTLAAVVRHRGIPLLSLHVAGNGRIGRREDGRLGFTSIELDVTAETGSADDVGRLEAAIERSERGCLVSNALDVPVDVRATIAVDGETTPLPTLHGAG
jgi:organic hydroperoxide reductase OsmC/OhrA